MASVDGHIPGGNVKPMVRNATAVEAKDISLASTGSHMV